MTGQGSDLDGVLLSKVTPTICPLTLILRAFPLENFPIPLPSWEGECLSQLLLLQELQVSSWIWNTSMCYSLAETPFWSGYNVCFCLWVVKVGKSGWMWMGGGEGSAVHKLTIIFIVSRGPGWDQGERWDFPEPAFSTVPWIPKEELIFFQIAIIPILCLHALQGEDNYKAKERAELLQTLWCQEDRHRQFMLY